MKLMFIVLFVVDRLGKLRRTVYIAREVLLKGFLYSGGSGSIVKS